MENTGVIDDCTEVSVKQEPLVEDVCSDVKYPVDENQTAELYVHPSLPVETCRMQQELLSTCNGQAFGACTTVKRQVAPDSTHLDDVKQTGNGSPFCIGETESVAQLTCSTNFPFLRGQTEKVMTNVPGPDFYKSLPVSMALAVDATPFPVALYQHGPIQSISENRSYKKDRDKSQCKIALDNELTMSTSYRKITSDNVTSEHGLESQETHRCSDCDYSTARKRNLLVHMRTHTRDKQYKCSACSYRSTLKSSLVVHTRTHTGEKPYKCSNCDYSAAQNNSLVIHMRTHTGEKPFKCQVCNLAFSTKSHTRRHMRSHTGEKPYNCSICDYKSAYQHDVTSHMKKHTGEKPHKCSRCEYVSVYKSHLVQHLRTHTGEKPYKCSICDYSAVRKSILVIHIKTHTENKPHL